MILEEWLADFFNFYRELDFLGECRDLKTEEFVNAFEELDCEQLVGLEAVIDDIDDVMDLFSDDDPEFYRGGTREVSSTYNKFCDLRLLGILDPRRVWWRWRDYDCDFQLKSSGRKDYSEMIHRFAEISRGALDIKRINETHGIDDNSVWIDIELINGEQSRFLAHYKFEDSKFSDKISLPDLTVLESLNAMIARTGYSFEAYERLILKKDYMPFNATAYVTVLTLDEKEKIKAERGWVF